MEAKETNNTNVEGVNMSEHVDGVEMAQQTTPPSDKEKTHTAFVAPSDGKGEHGLAPLAVKNDGTHIANGLMLTLKTGVVYTKNMSFVAGTTGKTSENFLAHNWTKRKIKLLFLLNKYLPTHKKTVRDYKDGLNAIKLSDMQESNETFLNVLTQIFIPLRDLSLDLDAKNGARLIDQTRAELGEIGAIETTYFFNAIIEDKNIPLDRTGPLLYVEDGHAPVNRAGVLKNEKGVFVTYNNLWLYGNFASVPANVVELLDTYGNDTALFLRLFIHFVDVRGTKTSEKHITSEINKKVAEMKRHNTRGKLWTGFLHNTRNKQVSALYTQQRVLDILGKRDDGKQWYITTKKFTDKKTGAVYMYENVFDTPTFQKDLTNAVNSCTNMGVLTVARVFTIPRNKEKAEKVVKEICKVFPGLAHNIKKLTPSDGVCCCVTFNGKWGYETDTVEAVEVKDDGTTLEPHNDGTHAEPANA